MVPSFCLRMYIHNVIFFLPGGFSKSIVIAPLFILTLPTVQVQTWHSENANTHTQNKNKREQSF